MSITNQPTSCQCSGPGYCPLMKRVMSEVRQQECKHKPHYFAMFLKEAGVQPTEQSKPTKQYGAGTELKTLLSSLGINPKGCQCNSRAVTMNANGIEWCENNVGTIVGWLRDEANTQKFPFSNIVARMLVKWAIRRAKKRLKIGAKQ